MNGKNKRWAEIRWDRIQREHQQKEQKKSGVNIGKSKVQKPKNHP